jgi:hypothetical protein
LKEKVLIADDSISAKIGKDIELVSYHFDHKIGRSILGNCHLQLGYHQCRFLNRKGARHKTDEGSPHSHRFGVRRN